MVRRQGSRRLDLGKGLGGCAFSAAQEKEGLGFPANSRSSLLSPGYSPPLAPPCCSLPPSRTLRPQQSLTPTSSLQMRPGRPWGRKQPSQLLVVVTEGLGGSGTFCIQSLHFPTSKLSLPSSSPAPDWCSFPGGTG